MRNRRYADDYLNFLYVDGGNDRHFSESIADAAWNRYLVDWDRAAVLRWRPVRTSKIRLHLRKAPRSRIRLVELKLF